MPSVTVFDQTAVPVSAGSTISRGAPQRSSPLHLRQQRTQLAGENKDKGLDSHESTITPSSEGWDCKRNRMDTADRTGSTS